MIPKLNCQYVETALTSSALDASTAARLRLRQHRKEKRKLKLYGLLVTKVAAIPPPLSVDRPPWMSTWYCTPLRSLATISRPFRPLLVKEVLVFYVFSPLYFVSGDRQMVPPTRPHARWRSSHPYTRLAKAGLPFREPLADSVRFVVSISYARAHDPPSFLLHSTRLSPAVYLVWYNRSLRVTLPSTRFIIPRPLPRFSATLLNLSRSTC